MEQNRELGIPVTVEEYRELSDLAAEEGLSHEEFARLAIKEGRLSLKSRVWKALNRVLRVTQKYLPAKTTTSE